MKSSCISIFFTIFLIISPSKSLNADILTFDDIPGATGTLTFVPNGYGGLFWENALAYSIPGNPRLVSGNWGVSDTVTGALHATSSDVFDFSGAFFSSAIDEPCRLVIYGYNNGNLLYELTASLNISEPGWVQADFYGIDHLTLMGQDSQFFMDNFTFVNKSEIQPVPEPSVICQFLIGLSVLTSIRFLSNRSRL